ncbi:MAG: hypothetical protein KJ052_08510 [Candidatus Hydrogenedentes bacterium]|nr:hypothetical protein [Candidatus Hydrogenedentota bacterium]
MKRNELSHFAALAMFFIVGGAAWAVSPSLSTIIPRGAARGGEADVTFHGGNLDDAVDVIFHDPGITLVSMEVKSASEVACKLNIAPDVVPGPKAFRIRTKTGVSNLKRFSVGALAEVAETEPNNSADQSQAIALGTTVNGVVANEDVDFYAVELAEGQRLAVEVEGLRLGDALFDPKVRLFGPGGHERVAEDDTALVRQDAAFLFVAPESGVHRVAVSEAAYGGAGNFYYRLHVGEFPRPLSAVPLGGPAGTECEVRFLGDPGLDALAVTIPAIEAGTGGLPVSTATGITPTPLPFRVNELAQTIEAEPNNSLEAAMLGAVPGAFNGVIGEPDDEDWFQFEGKKDTTLEVLVWARRLGSPLDSVLSINKPSGENLMSNDDSVGLDSTGRITLPEDGVYTMRITDHLRSGGPTYGYRIELAPIEPVLSVKFLDNDPCSFTVPANNRAFGKLSISRSDFDAPLSVQFDGLPQGITADLQEIPAGTTQVPVVFSATADAPVAGSLVNLIASSTNPDLPVQGGLVQQVNLVLGNNRVVFLDHEVNRLAMAASEPAPFAIEMAPLTTPIVRNGSKPLRFVATRAEGFVTPIDLTFVWLSGGLSGPSGQIKEGETETTVVLEANGGAALGEQTLVAQATSAGYKVCTPFTPITVSEPWVAFTLPEVQTDQGQGLEYVVQVAQATPFEGTFPVSLYGLPKGVEAPELQLAPDSSELRFPLTVAEDAAEGKHENIGLRTTLVVNEEELRHNAGGGKLAIFKPLPPELQQPEPEVTTEEAPAADQPEPLTRFP